MSDLRRPRRARSNAFDLDRVDRDDVEVTSSAPLGALLPKVTPKPVPVAGAASAAPADSVSARSSSGAAPKPRGERPRGSGGRAGTTGSASRITATAARIPVELYDRAEVLVKGRGLPSWGQLIAWTCATRGDEVVDEVVTLLRPVEGVLVPRGQNKRGVAATQITARFTPGELGAFEHAREQAQRAVAAVELEDEVTATAVVIAALTVAVHAAN